MMLVVALSLLSVVSASPTFPCNGENDTCLEDDLNAATDYIYDDLNWAIDKAGDADWRSTKNSHNIDLLKDTDEVVIDDLISQRILSESTVERIDENEAAWLKDTDTRGMGIKETYSYLTSHPNYNLESYVSGICSEQVQSIDDIYTVDAKVNQLAAFFGFEFDRAQVRVDAMKSKAYYTGETVEDEYWTCTATPNVCVRK